VQRCRSGRHERPPQPGWTKIYSPIDGIAGIAPVQLGDLVTPSTVLTSVSQVDPMKVTFPISERQYLRSREITKHQEKGGQDQPDLQLILVDSNMSASGPLHVVNRGSSGRQGRSWYKPSSQRCHLHPACTPGVERPRKPSAAPRRAGAAGDSGAHQAVVGSDNKSLRTVKKGAAGRAWIMRQAQAGNES
jgi:membrane fusion protein (multidrug efflux system)